MDLLKDQQGQALEKAALVRCQSSLYLSSGTGRGQDAKQAFGTGNRKQQEVMAFPESSTS